MDDDKIKNLSWPRQMEPNGFMKFLQYTCYEKTTELKYFELEF